jgi:DNA-binding SARP family transcriptional activator
VLGPLEVVDGETSVAVRGRNPRALLAVLLLSRGEVVSTDRLVDALWGAEPPRTAPTSLQNAVSQLRKGLGSDRIVTKSPGYTLRLGEGEFDVDRVRALVADARAREGEDRVRLLRDAEGLWRGPPLSDFAYDAFAQSAIARLEELRLNVIEERLETELGLGDRSELAPELEALVADYPLRERLRAQLMLVLYRAGRQADALQVYQEGRRILVDQLGIDPGPELKRLHTAILRHERSLDHEEPLTSPEESLVEATRALLAGRLVPVLGTEVGELARRLAERFDIPVDGEGLTSVAEHAAVLKGSGPLYDELHELLSAETKPTPIHRFFASLPALLAERGLPRQVIVTTSFDLALEQAFADAGEQFDVVTYLAIGRDQGKFCHFSPDGQVRVVDVPNTYATDFDFERRTVILKLHGSLDPRPERQWESFVVTEDDYIGYLGHGALAASVPVALAARLRRSHFLFLGYGMREWNLRLVLNRLWPDAAVDYRSWAVAPATRALDRALWRRRDVELVDAELEDYVAMLAQRCGATAGVKT